MRSNLKSFAGKMVTEASVNGFRSAKIAETFQEDPYRFLACSDKCRPATTNPSSTHCTSTSPCG